MHMLDFLDTSSMGVTKVNESDKYILQKQK
jgi:hypothetical protein